MFEQARKAGFVRVRVNGEVHDLSEEFDLDKQKWHTIEIVVDRLVSGESADTSRVTDSVETALRMADGTVLVDIPGEEEMLFSEHFACVHCKHQPRRAGTPHLQLQQTARRLRHMHRTGLQT